MNVKSPSWKIARGPEQRLRRNAMVLALAQMIQGDEVVLDEVRQSIGSLTSSEMGWLKEVQKLEDKCESPRRDHAALLPPAKSQPGDIGCIRTLMAGTCNRIGQRGETGLPSGTR